MDRPTLIRRVRIGASAICLLFCVAFVGLWIRSYSWQDSAHCPLPGNSVDPIRKRWVRRPGGTRFVPSPRMLLVGSYEGRLSLYAGEDQPGVSGWFPWGCGMDTFYTGDYPPRKRPLPMWYYDSHKYGRSILIPHWLPALVFGVLAAAFGIGTPYRFSLRALLIVTTLIAVALGLALR